MYHDLSVWLWISRQDGWSINSLVGGLILRLPGSDLVQSTQLQISLMADQHFVWWLLVCVNLRVYVNVCNVSLRYTVFTLNGTCCAFSCL